MEIKRLGWEHNYRYGVVDIIGGEETLLHTGNISECYAYIKCDNEDLFQVKRKASEVVSPVMSPRFDEEIEKVMSMVEWSDYRDRKIVLDLFKKMQSAISHQKISET
jgi:hypothetical protein